MFSNEFNAKLPLAGPLEKKSPLKVPRVFFTKRPGSSHISDLSGGVAEAGPPSKRQKTSFSFYDHKSFDSELYEKVDDIIRVRGLSV